jgi:DNA-binding CsgD family transcriptional regulator
MLDDLGLVPALEWLVQNMRHRAGLACELTIDDPAIALPSAQSTAVFRMLAGGQAVSDVAAQLNLSVKTVSTHKARLMQKLGVSTTAELVRYALMHRLTGDDAIGARRAARARSRARHASPACRPIPTPPMRRSGTPRFGLRRPVESSGADVSAVPMRG